MQIPWFDCIFRFLLFLTWRLCAAPWVLIENFTVSFYVIQKICQI